MGEEGLRIACMRRHWGSGLLQPGEEKANGRVYNNLWVGR